MKTKPRRTFRPGFEKFAEFMPNLTPGQDLMTMRLALARNIMGGLAKSLKETAPWLNNVTPPNTFERSVVAMEGLKQLPDVSDRGELTREELDALCAINAQAWAFATRPKVPPTGFEMIVAHHGIGHETVVHGHGPGFLHEEVLTGKLMVNTYRRMNIDTVRITRTLPHVPGSVMSSTYGTSPDRSNFIHSLRAVEPSTSLHFLPEPPPNGQGNTFIVEHFDDLDNGDVQQIPNTAANTQLHPGDVVLVRSENVPWYGDHFMVVTGGPTLKEHGLRPAEFSFSAGPSMSELLDSYRPLQMGVILLKLNNDAAEYVREFHGISYNPTTNNVINLHA